MVGFAGGSDSKESACDVGDPDLIPGSGRSPGGGNSNPFQYSCLENSMDRGAWQVQSMGLQRVRHILNTEPAGIADGQGTCESALLPSAPPLPCFHSTCLFPEPSRAWEEL